MGGSALNKMEKHKIFICGNFGYKSGELGGQTVKTRVLADALIRQYGAQNVTISDTSEWKSNPLATFLKIKKSFMGSKHIIILPARKGVMILLPLFAFWKKKYKKNVRYVVIGGWLPRYAEKFKMILNALKVFDGVYIETRTMKQKLNRLGIKRVKVMPNFRYFETIEISKEEEVPIAKAVIMTRIIKDKGLDVAVAAVQALNQKLCTPCALFRNQGSVNNDPITLHVYGQIYRGYKKEFNRLIEAAGPSIVYMGHVEPDIVQETLRKYDIMLLATRYDGEGFPGAVIEAFSAGLPVILSDWQYNKEVVEHNETGLLFKTDDLDDLVNKLEYLVLNPNKVKEMAFKCINKAEGYKVDNVIKIILEDMK